MINPIRLQPASGQKRQTRLKVAPRRFPSAPALIAPAAALCFLFALTLTASPSRADPAGAPGTEGAVAAAAATAEIVSETPAASQSEIKTKTEKKAKAKAKIKAKARSSTVLALSTLSTEGDVKRRVGGRARNLGGSPLAALGGLVAAPILAGYRQTSGFGVRRGKKHWHMGVDLAAPRGTAVRAAAAGVVEKVERQRGYGKIVVIGHPGGLETRYAHLSAFSVKPGERVAAGQKIGAVGTTGRSTGPHLHFELRKDGMAIDPTALLAPEKIRQRIALAPVPASGDPTESLSDQIPSWAADLARKVTFHQPPAVEKKKRKSKTRGMILTDIVAPETDEPDHRERWRD